MERGEDINAADPARRATHWGKKYNAITYALRGGENYRLHSTLEVVDRPLSGRGPRPARAVRPRPVPNPIPDVGR